MLAKHTLDSCVEMGKHIDIVVRVEKKIDIDRLTTFL